MPIHRSKTGRRLVEGDPLIFRFKCTWEECPGSTRHLVLIYYREDETMELRENHDINCGRYKAPIFLKRGRYLKENKEGYMPPPGFREDRILLNVVRSRGPGRLNDNYLKDNADDSYAKKRAYFTEEDFHTGRSIKVEGRDVLLIDCDPVTKEYYRRAHSREMEEIEVILPERKISQKEIPPYNGFGDEEDSLTSCGGLEPKPPKKNFNKFMNKDRIGFNSHVLRFEGKDLNGDSNSKFVISYYLSDDTISVTKVVDENSGSRSIKFLKRGRIKKNNEGNYYGPDDFYVGGVVVFYGHEFLLVSADEYVFDYMESERESFPQSNLRIILKKLRHQMGPKGIKALMAKFLERDVEENEALNERTFREVLLHHTEKSLSEHEMVTLIRFYKNSEESASHGPPWQLFSLLQSELKKIHYTGFNELLLCLMDRDKENRGLLDRESIRSGILAAIITHSQSRTYSIRCILDQCLDSYTDKELNYEEVLNKMNWTKFPAKPVPPQFVRENYNMERKRMGALIYRSISYIELIKALEVQE